VRPGHAIRVFGEDFRLAELTPAALDRYISQRRGEGAGDGTIHKEGWTEAPSRPCAESHDRRRSARIGRVRWAFVKIVVRVLTLATATDNVLSVGGALDRGADGRTPRP